MGQPDWVKNVKRGRMNQAERDEIDRVIANMKNPTPGKVAVRVNRHPATINWYMLSHGMLSRKKLQRCRAYIRNGVRVEPYLDDHDARMLQLRESGMSMTKIAARLTEEFHIPRTYGSVKVRLTILASLEDEAAA